MINVCFSPSIPIVIEIHHGYPDRVKIILHWGGIGYRAKDYLQLLLPEPAVCIASGVKQESV